MLTERIQALLDEKIEGSPRARELLGELEGRCMRCVVRFTAWEVSLVAGGGRLRLWRSGAPAPDVTLAGTPLSLLGLLREDPTVVIRRGDVQLGGDGDTGTRFQELAQLLRPDLEEGLSRIVGDIPAWGIGSLLRRALAYGRASATTQADNVGEYLAHERQLLVPRAEGQQFIEDVDALREQADRLEARVAQLEAREEHS